MATIFTDRDALADAIKGRFATPAIIGIDGWTGVGKTTLAKHLASALHGAAYDLDEALARDQKRYVPALCMEEITKALEQTQGLLLVSGICLRHVLETAGRAADAHIYIKRMAVWGWADEDELIAGKLPEVPGASGEFIREELRRYHEGWRPHERAEYEFHWVR